MSWNNKKLIKKTFDPAKCRIFTFVHQGSKVNGHVTCQHVVSLRKAFHENESSFLNFKVLKT